ncbi:MAG: 50S ribosomal protein L10 [Candidatus Margulisbacteria bacterium]|nr:50S ribosomal protein L10 [Candidatus Margulisiibacteriota bacterium]
MGNAKTLEKKQQTVANLKEKIDSAKVIVLSDFRKVTVKEITSLRKKLRADGSEYKIIKNTLLKKALEAAGFAGLDEHLQGPTGVLLGYKDPVAPLKLLVEFFEEIEKGEIRTGVIEKLIIDKKGVTSVAKLPPREVLIGKVVSGFKAPIYGLVNVMQGPIRKLAYALNAIKQSKGG